MVAIPRIALLLDTSTTWGAWIAQGAARYAEQHGPWLFALEPRGKNELFRLPRGRVDGVIARVNNPALAEQIVRSRLPAVNVSWFRYRSEAIVQCTVDEAAMANLAARYFLERGYHHFAYYGPGGRPPEAEACRMMFTQQVREAGGSFAQRLAKPVQAWQRQCDGLTDWLADRPRPLALFTFDAAHGWQAAEACLLAGLRVPDEVAILAGDHDELMASIAMPRLSAIDPVPRQVGYEAAALLDRLLRGRRPPVEPVRVPPAGILERGSTDALAVEDETLAAAIRYIRTHACGPLRVGDVLAQVPMARRTLELAFRTLLGRGPAAEIRRLRLERARRLLAHSDLPLHEIALRCGFADITALGRAFRRAFGQNPAHYRHHAESPREK